MLPPARCRWNVYDAINVWRTYGVGDPVPAFSDSDFAAVQGLGYWLETAKMRSNLTGNLLGGVLLADVAESLRAAAGARSTVVGGPDATVPTAPAAMNATYYKLLSVSSHYNTQLGLLAALGIDAYAPAQGFQWLTSIPRLAAVMVFELHAAASGLHVRLAAQDGPSANYTTVPLPCASGAAAAAVGQGACTLQVSRDWSSCSRRSCLVGAQAAMTMSMLTSGRVLWVSCVGLARHTTIHHQQLLLLRPTPPHGGLPSPPHLSTYFIHPQDFLALADQRSFQRVEDWCDACRNTAVSACRLDHLEEVAGHRKDAEPWHIAVSVCVTFAGTLLAVAAGVLLVQRCRARRREGASSHYAAGSSALPDSKASGMAGPFVQMSMANTI